MTSVSLFIQPIITAFTGWFVIWLMLRLLFKNILPKNKAAIAVRSGDAVSGLFNLDEIINQLKDPAALAEVMPSIETHIDEFLHTRLKEKIPVIAVFIGESTIKKLKEGLMEEIEALLPEVIGQYADSISSKIDIGQLVTAQINQLSIEKTEAALRIALGKELRQMQLAGAIIGLIIGLIMMGISLLLQI